MRNDKLMPGEPDWALDYPFQEISRNEHGAINRRCVCGVLLVYISEEDAFAWTDFKTEGFGRDSVQKYQCPTCGRRPSTSFGNRLLNFL